MLDDEALLELWRTAGELDDTVRLTHKDFPQLRTKFVAAQPYTRDSLFSRMARTEPTVARGVPVSVNGARTPAQQRRKLLHAIRSAYSQEDKARVHIGPRNQLIRTPVHLMLQRWERGRAILGVTDLHTRGTWLDNVLNTRALSDFNVMTQGSHALAAQEMMSLIICTQGHVTDSHTDDPDGTNHCFVGRKLWLAWDTFEGMNAGLQDVSRQRVYGTARFSMHKFLALRSSRWFLVSPGDTLFLPGNLAHKVFTLEAYLGIGSFHLGLPGCLTTLSRWLVQQPLWSLQDSDGVHANLAPEAVELCRRRAEHCYRATLRTQRRWGYGHLATTYDHWLANTDNRTRRRACEHPGFAALVRMSRNAADQLRLAA